jgi:hypothetical protein
MFGNFQQSNLRIELNAPEPKIRDSLLHPSQFRQWLWPQSFSEGLPETLEVGTIFTGWIGPIAIRHEVQSVDEHGIRFLLSQGIEGFHQWHWGDGWVQSSLEGISMLPINLGQTLSLLRLKAFLKG